MARAWIIWRTAALGTAMALLRVFPPIYAQASLPGPPPEHTTDDQEIFAEFVARHQARSDSLLGYTVNRTDRISHPAGKVHAKATDADA